jgi:acetolactate synthase regulatory subunit
LGIGSEELITGDCLAQVVRRRGFWVKAVNDEELDREVLRIDFR